MSLDERKIDEVCAIYLRPANGLCLPSSKRLVYTLKLFTHVSLELDRDGTCAGVVLHFIHGLLTASLSKRLTLPRLLAT